MSVESIREKVVIPNVSLPSLPKSFGKEYEFPESLDNLPSMELGSWLLKMAAWRGYTLRLLSKSEMDETILDEYFASKISVEVAKSTDKKITKDQAHGRVISTNEGATLRSNLIAKKAEVDRLKRVLEIYTIQFEAISREISRRSIEVRLANQGVMP